MSVVIFVALQVWYHFVDNPKNCISSGLKKRDLNLFQKTDCVELPASTVITHEIVSFTFKKRKMILIPLPPEDLMIKGLGCSREGTLIPGIKFVAVSPIFNLKRDIDSIWVEGGKFN